MRRAWIVAPLVAVLPALAVSCGSNGASSTPDAGGGNDATSGDVAVDTSMGGGETGTDARGDSSPVTDGGAGDAPAEAYVVPGVDFAFQHYYLGDTDRSGTASPTAWQAFGVNVDGKVTTASSTDVCTLTAGAALTTQVDGTAGIDNSWGANILPIFLTLDASFSSQYNAAVAAGLFTNMVDLVGPWGDAGLASGPLPGMGFEGASLTSPTFTVADDWPVFPNWLNDGGLPSGSRIGFPGGAVGDAGAWASGTPVDFPIHMAFGLQTVEVVVHATSVALAYGSPTSTSGGVVGGVLHTQEFLNALQAAASWSSMSLACGTAWQSIAQQIEQAQDILADGTNVAGQPCDAISIGLGFDGVRIGPVETLAQPSTPLQNLCDAGGD